MKIHHMPHARSS